MRFLASYACTSDVYVILLVVSHPVIALLCPQKILLLKVLHLVSLFFVSCALFKNLYFHSLSVFFLLSFLGLFLMHFVELASIMSESSDYCQSCERNLYWSMYEIDLDEFSGDVMVAGHSIYVAIIGN